MKIDLRLPIVAMMPLFASVGTLAAETERKPGDKKATPEVKESHFRLDISKKQSRVSTPRDKSNKGSKKGSSKKTTKYNNIYHFKLGYNLSKPISDVGVRYFILKRTTVRGDKSPGPVNECIKGKKQFSTLESKEPRIWESRGIICESSSTKSKSGSSSSKERVIGAMVIVSVGGKELFREYDSDSSERELTEYFEEFPGELKEEAPAAKKKGKKKKKSKKKKKEEPAKDE